MKTLEAPSPVKTPKTEEAPVHVASFGDGTFETTLDARERPVRDVLSQFDIIDIKTRRISVNGHAVTLDHPVRPGDSVQVISRIYGG